MQSIGEGGLPSAFTGFYRVLLSGSYLILAVDADRAVVVEVVPVAAALAVAAQRRRPQLGPRQLVHLGLELGVAVELRLQQVHLPSTTQQ